MSDPRTAPAVSIIVPVYNVAPYLREALDSLISQTFTDIEIICVNDGSTDGSLDILVEYAGKDERIRLIDQENSGLGHSRNVGFDKSNGEYVYFFDSDDILNKDAIETLVCSSEQYEADIVSFSTKVMYETEQLMQEHRSFDDYFHRKNSYNGIMSGQDALSAMIRNRELMVPPWLYFFKRSFLVSDGIRFINDMHEDESFAVTALMNARRVIVLDKTLHIYRVRGKSIMTSGINSLKSSYGCMQNILSILEYVSDRELKEGLSDQLEIKMKWLLSAARSRASLVSIDELDSFVDNLDFKNRILFKTIVLEQVNDSRRIKTLERSVSSAESENNSLEERIDALRKELNEKKTEIASLESKLEKKQQKITSLKNDKRDLKSQLREVKEKYKKLKDSKRYRYASKVARLLGK